MKKLILAASALISAAALTSTANAADMTPVPSAYDWTGFYFGLNAGVAWNNTEIDNDINWNGSGWNPADAAVIRNLGESLTDDDAVFTGGAMLGYNWQMDSFVLGVEADINYLGFDGEQDNDFSIFSGNYTGTHDLSAQADWYGTLRGRLGFAADNFLFYGTGGLAYGHMEAESDLRVYDAGGNPAGHWDGSADDVNWGWTIGAGVEYGIDNWSLGVEYLFVDLGEADWDSDNNGPASNFDNFSAEGSVDYQFSVVRATAKIRF